MTDNQDKDAGDKEILEKIFCFDKDRDEIPQSWKAWKAGESDYKPFSLQFSECNKDMTLFSERCNACGHLLLMCKKYGGQCRSSKCRDTRVKKGE
jgi:hypothetical protein